VYFIVSGEWHAEIRTRSNVTEQEIRAEFIEIGNALHEADAHNRMVGIHPMTRHGSVREFNQAKWMSFADYQQNYRMLHARILESRPDIIMAGGYPVTGYGTTYMGGNRDKGPFNVDDPRNDIWERQYHVPQNFLSKLEWWRLQPHDDWISSATARSSDRNVRIASRSLLCPPKTTYWLLAEPGEHYLVYVRGLKDKVGIELGPRAAGVRKARLLDPRTGQTKPFDVKMLEGRCEWSPPDAQDWVLHLSR
jgi:hypothetical protein